LCALAVFLINIIIRVCSESSTYPPANPSIIILTELL